jgi:putative flavoprotein involved in K+ transport
VIWATGFRVDHGWVDVPDARDRAGAIIQRRGVTPVPGLYTLGLSWQHTRGSGLLGFVGHDAAYLATRIGETHGGRAERTSSHLIG